MENIMKITLIRKLVAVALIALFSQFSLAQDAGGAIENAEKQIADIVAHRLVQFFDGLVAHSSSFKSDL